MLSGEKSIRLVLLTATVSAVIIAGIWFVSQSSEQVLDSSKNQESPATTRRMHREHQKESAKVHRHSGLQEINRLLAEAKPLGHGEIRNEGVIELLRQMAAYDPAAAIEFADQHPELHGQFDFVAELFGGWIERDEMSARDWLGGVPAGNLRIQVVPVLVAHLASDHPEEALALAGELPGYDGELEPLRPFGKWDHGDEIEGRIREKTYAGIFGEWAGSDPVAAAARATELEDSLLRNLATQEVAAKWIRKDSAAAIEWMNQLPAGAVRNSALQGLVPEWTAQNPQAAASFLMALADSPERSEWLRSLGENWSSSDPKTALTWATQLPGESERNQVVQTVLAKVAESGGRQAADFVLTLPAGATRTQGMETVLTRWRANDAEAVSAWVNALPRESQRDEARAILATE